MLCNDNCTAHSRGFGGPYGNNSFCQDGAAGDDKVTGNTCAYGTDCTDCGRRYMMPPSAPPSQPPPPPSQPPLTGATTTLAGSGSAGFLDGAGGSARFNQPLGVAIDPTGTFTLVAVRAA